MAPTGSLFRVSPASDVPTMGVCRRLCGYVVGMDTTPLNIGAKLFVAEQ
jgi:hypothetical protein